ncbi:MAG: TIGR00730 family Rossman fold protein [Candidatus Pacebacteria bacterium]|nr:TIGR00730 family Rossman fold protein [Candidatus Paceibacterota bacterium]
MTDEIKEVAQDAIAVAPEETPNKVAIVGHKHLTLDEIKKGCVEGVGVDEDGVRLCRINSELHQGITEMEAYDKAVTFYGSARFKEGDEYYEKARKLGYRISKELGYTVVTGGGPGIMEGGNRGAFEAGGKSVGLAIALPHEQKSNPYITDDVPFHYFFTRKAALAYSSEVFIFFPGGFGTMDEFFEQLTLVQTGKLKPIPLVLYGSDFWQPFVDLWRAQMVEKYHTVTEQEMALFIVTDDDNLVLDIVKKAPMRTENRI